MDWFVKLHHCIVIMTSHCVALWRLIVSLCDVALSCVVIMTLCCFVTSHCLALWRHNWLVFIQTYSSHYLALWRHNWFVLIQTYMDLLISDGCAVVIPFYSHRLSDDDYKKLLVSSFVMAAINVVSQQKQQHKSSLKLLKYGANDFIYHLLCYCFKPFYSVSSLL